MIGDPIKHSISPQIHTAFAKSSGQNITYTKLRVRPADFAVKVKDLLGLGVKGMNITLPLKELAFAFANKLSPRAKFAGAVNTFKIEQGMVYGDNTDGIGLIRDITQNLKADITDKKILLLGAGGAAKGIIKPLLEEAPEVLHIANRTISKAIELKNQAKVYNNVSASGFAAVSDKFDFIINATSASVNHAVPPISAKVIDKNTVCYDLMYSKEPTSFLLWAQQHGAKITTDGLGMLVEQAAESFYLWRKIRPATQDLLLKLRK